MRFNLFIILALLVFSVSSADAQIRRTSTDLSNEAVLPTVIVSAPLVPVGTVVNWGSAGAPDPANWLECNGQAVPAGTKYDKLRSLYGSNVPNYHNQFLRGTTDTGQVGQTVSDSIKSHTVAVPGQNAAVSGTASPQSFEYVWTGQSQAATMISAQNGVVGLADYNNTYNNASSMTAGGTITGVASVQPTTGVYNGASETAPVHTKVRLFIRAVQ